MVLFAGLLIYTKFQEISLSQHHDRLATPFDTGVCCDYSARRCPCLFRCPDLHTMVLFVGSLSHTIFLEIFLRQQHDSLASLQVLF